MRFDAVARAFRDELAKIAAELQTTSHTHRGSMPAINFRRLEEHANEHRLMELLGLGARGRPMISKGGR